MTHPTRASELPRPLRANLFRSVLVLLLLTALVIPTLSPSAAAGRIGTVPGSSGLSPSAPAPALPGVPPSTPASPAPAPAVGPLASARGWINVSARLAAQPPPVLWDSLTYDPVDGYALLFGGCSTTVCPMPAQTWSYANASWRNLTSGSAQPAARSYAMLAFDGTDGYALLFGGVNATAAFNDTWSFVRGVWTDRTALAGPAPSPRWGASLAYDPSDGYLVLFGGSTAGGAALSDTWTYAGGHWRNITGSAGSPPARFEASMVWDAADQEVVLADGCGATLCPLNDTWAFQGGQWSDISGQASPLPPARYLAMMTYDRAASFAILFGGYTGASARSDTWTFQNNRWSNLTGSLGTAPSARGSGAVMEDTAAYPTSGEVVLPYVLLYGGDHKPCSTCAVVGIQDTWVFESPPTASGSFAPGSPEAGAAIAFTGTASGGTGPYTFDWTFADGATATGASVVHAFPVAGTYANHVTAVDAAGAPGTATVSVTVVPGPSASASASAGDTDVGVAVTFTSTPSGGVAPYTVSWTLGDGTVANATSVIHAFAAVGAQTNTAVVTDAEGGRAIAVVNVTVHPIPSVTIAAASPVAVGTSTTLSATGSGGVAPFTYSWQLGDGATANGSTVSHIYASPGSFAVTVTVTDAVGATAQNTTVLAVANASAPGSGASSLPLAGIAIGLVLAGLAAGVVIAILRRRPPRTPVAPPRASPPKPAPPAPRPAWDEGP